MGLRRFGGSDTVGGLICSHDAMKLRVHHKLFLSFSSLVAVVILALSLGVDITLREPLIQQAKEDLRRELALGAEVVERFPEVAPDSLARRIASLIGHRVTLMEPDGRVVGDSGMEPDQVPLMDDHSFRPEVVDARRDGEGVSVRYSTSVDTDLIYAARVLSDGRTLRFAMSTTAIDRSVAGVRRQILAVGGVALGLAALFSLAFSLAVTRPLRWMRAGAARMADGDLSARIGLGRSDELGDLGTALDRLADQLERRLGQLEGEREEMRALIDSMAEGVLALDRKGTVRRANPAAQAIFGLSSDPRGLGPQEVARRKGFLKLVEGALGGEEVATTELRYGDRHLLATARPLPRGGAVLVFLDTTELRRLEGVRRDFVANASHELKTPLTVIRGHAETLLDDDLPPPLRRRFTERLHANAERLQAILEDLLDLSRIESGGWRVNPEPVSLDILAREAWMPFTGSAEARGLTFQVVADPDATEVEADRGALLQVYTNLFSNALRYTPDGGGIQVRIAPLAGGPSAGGGARVSVSDTGPGIAEPHLSRIFERFYRADQSRSRDDGGTGLGLAIVRHLVERHGGTVGAESEVGKGTTIHFTLPFRPTASPRPEPQSPRSKAGSSPDEGR